MEEIINFFTEDIDYTLRSKRKIRLWIADAIAHEGGSLGPINIILCSDKYLYSMNVEYLKHDTLTDVITFDYGEESLISGDVFISLERVRENAKGFTTAVTKELHRVIIHGVMHLCGQNDKAPEDRAEMTRKENFFLDKRAESGL